MRVLFNTYPWAFATPGGGEIQLLKYAEYLSQRGIDVIRHDMWTQRFDAVDVVHFFSCISGSIPFCNYVKGRGLPLVVSPSLWITKDTVDRYPTDEIRAQLMLADLIVPNSVTEADMLVEVLELPRERFRPVMNGADDRFAQAADPALFRRTFGVDGAFALNVGNIELRKNQLNLVRALGSDGPPLLLIGNIREPDYAKRVLDEGGSRVRYLDAMPHEDPLLASAYAACSVFILPSLLETPGLAALEAASIGAPIVITSVGSTQEYFRDMAHYVDPLDPGDIRRKIDIAMVAGAHPRLKAHVSTQFTWPAAAAMLAKIYAEAFDRDNINLRAPIHQA